MNWIEFNNFNNETVLVNINHIYSIKKDPDGNAMIQVWGCDPTCIFTRIKYEKFREVVKLLNSSQANSANRTLKVLLEEKEECPS